MSSGSRELPRLTEAQCDAIIDDLDASFPSLREVLARIAIGIPVFALIVAVCAFVGMQFPNAQLPVERALAARIVWYAGVGAGVIVLGSVCLAVVAKCCHWLGSLVLAVFDR